MAEADKRLKNCVPIALVLSLAGCATPGDRRPASSPDATIDKVEQAQVDPNELGRSRLSRGAPPVGECVRTTAQRLGQGSSNFRSMVLLSGAEGGAAIYEQSPPGESSASVVAFHPVDERGVVGEAVEVPIDGTIIDARFVGQRIYLYTKWPLIGPAEAKSYWFYELTPGGDVVASVPYSGRREDVPLDAVTGLADGGVRYWFGQFSGDGLQIDALDVHKDRGQSSIDERSFLVEAEGARNGRPVIHDLPGAPSSNTLIFHPTAPPHMLREGNFVSLEGGDAGHVRYKFFAQIEVGLVDGEPGFLWWHETPEAFVWRDGAMVRVDFPVGARPPFDSFRSQPQPDGDVVISFFNLAGEVSTSTISFEAEDENVDPLRWQQAWFGNDSALLVSSPSAPHEFQLWWYACEAIETTR